MTAVTFTVQGMDRLQRKLGNIADFQRVIRPEMRGAVMEIQRGMADYPPQRSGSTYRRTGTLGRGWTTRVQDNFQGVTGTVGNRVRYGPLVQSHRFQSAIHRGRWQTDKQVLTQRKARIQKRFQRAIDRELSK